MDRLVCGDVGFGKTEVAIRTAYRAVLAGYQVRSHMWSEWCIDACAFKC